ncbi:Ankyrin repeat domain-containing protein 27 [Triplophysa tibetana]|uniref:Ankyrin repeat domain-containing protein 27 n=1 Tax=Triplophysa tibetana TaxID=1572043 RepID=A0A5A9PPQ9_9TELE|nr:Ankyrin repeat domain-containing protein 27 [Triplophysa tibetana]
MAVYDENILKNPFYLALEKRRPDLCSRVAELRGIILVPCRGSLPVGTFPASQFDRYVLQPAEQGYQTLDGKEVSIKNNQVRLDAGFPSPISVPILFEETFYNEKEQAYNILCISRPLDSDHSPEEVSSVSATYCLKKIEDAREFLGRHAEKLDKFVEIFCQTFKEQERKGIRHHIDSVNTLYTKCLQSLLKDSHLKLLARQEIQMTLLKQAVEMYIHHGIHDLLFSYVGTLEASRDAAFNKTTRSLQDLQQKDLGVKTEFSLNIPRAKWELSELNACKSPQQKLLCLKKVILTIMQPIRRNDAAVNIEAMCADDLLLVILYLLVKTEIPNWMANLSYIKNFRFCNSCKDDLGYCLTSFEAAVEYISQGNLNQSTLEAGNRMSFRQKLDLLSQNAATPIDHLFEHIVSGNVSEVQRLLCESENEEDGVKMCHPLCSCDACDLRISGRLNDPSIVTPFSRDDRGYTPLHIAAICGQSALIDFLVLKGAAVNATDYHALTPLHLSCQKGFQGVTLLLLHYKANTDAQDINGNTALHLACMYGHEDCVKALVYFDLHACRLNVQNDKGDSPLHIAARWGYEGIMEVLLENGASTLIHNKAKETPLHCALNSKILSLLERRHNDSKMESGFESPSGSPQPSDCSSRRSSVSTMSSLEITIPETERIKHREIEKLLRAVADGDVQMLRYLLEWVDEEPEEEEVEVSAKTELCHPLCQCADCEPTQKKIAGVQQGGVGVNSRSVDGFTPLHVAALHGHTALVSLLTRHGANINARNNQSATPLHLACQNTHIQVVSALMECNAKLNRKDNYGNTPLIHACLKGQVEIATVLLESGALVNVVNNHGNTGLHEAVRGGHIQLVELLLHRGALIHIRNKRQRTVLDCAHDTGGKNTEIQRLLQKACAETVESNLIKSHSAGPERIVEMQRRQSPDGVGGKITDAKQRFQNRSDRAESTTGAVDQNGTTRKISTLKKSQMNFDKGFMVQRINEYNSCRICLSQTDRRRLTRGETIDSSGPFCHSQAQHDSSRMHWPHAKTKSLTRCHTISQDLTRLSLQTPEHISTADHTDELNELQESTDSIEPPQDLEQVTRGSASGQDEEKDDALRRGSDVESPSTEMDSVVL